MSKLFNERNILFLIIVNTITIFLNGFEQSPLASNIFFFLDMSITIVFVLEIIFKMKTCGAKSYFNSNWNTFDFILVAISVPSIFELFFPVGFDLSFLLVFRTLRVFKLFRFFKFVPNIDELLIGLKHALKSSVVILITFFIFIFIVGLLSNYMFSYSEHFSNPTQSLYSIFKIFTMEDWYVFQEDLTQNTGDIKGLLIHLYFISILVSGGIFGISLINSIFVESMIRNDKEKKDQSIESIQNQLEEIKEMLANKNQDS